MKDKIIFYGISLVVVSVIYPISKLYYENKSCQEDLKIYQQQEIKVKKTIQTNNHQINVIKKKLVANPNRAYREQLLSQIFTN